MPASPTVHFNAQQHRDRTACGFDLGRVEWRIDRKDVTCNSCQRTHAYREAKP